MVHFLLVNSAGLPIQPVCGDKISD